MLSGGPVRKDVSDHRERLFPSPLGERKRDAFPYLNPGEVGPVINRDWCCQQEREIDISFPNRGLLSHRQVYLPLCLPDTGKRVEKSSQRLADLVWQGHLD